MKPKAWSYSALNKFLTCPYQYYEVTVTRNFKDLQTEENMWGQRVHSEIDGAIRCNEFDMRSVNSLSQDQRDYVSKVLEPYTEGGELESERKIGLNQKLQPCEFFGKNIWLRAVLDVIHTNGPHATVIDWKTGKVRADEKQMKLFALVILWTRPEVNRVTTKLEWVVHKTCTVKEYHRSDIDFLIHSFLPDLKTFKASFVNNNWPKKPSGLCGKWCPVLSCEHNGRN